MWLGTDAGPWLLCWSAALGDSAHQKACREQAPPTLHCHVPRWPETPLHSLPPAALKDAQAEMLQGYRETPGLPV